MSPRMTIFARVGSRHVRNKNIRLLEFQPPHFLQIAFLSARLPLPAFPAQYPWPKPLRAAPFPPTLRRPPPICKSLAVLPIIPPYLVIPLNGLPKQRSA